MNKKYILTDETIKHQGHILHRIKAVRSFSYIKSGDLGGYIEKEENLSHDGECWVDDDAKVYDNANISGNAKVSNNALVKGNVVISGDALVYDNAMIIENAKVYGNADVSDNALIKGNAIVCEHARVYDNAMVFDNAWVFGYAEIFADAKVYGDANVSGDVNLFYNTQICGNANVSTDHDYMIFQSDWLNDKFFTWTRSNDMWSEDDFYGTSEELIEKAYKESEENGKNYEAYVKFVEIMKQNK